MLRFLITSLRRRLPVGAQRLLLELATMPLGRRLVRGAAASLAMTAASVLFGTASSVLLGRTLGPEGYGLYSFALLVIGIVTVPFWYGMSMLLTRETGHITAGGTRADMGVLLGRSYGLAVLVALIEMLLAGAIIWHLQASLSAPQLWASLAALPLILLSILAPLNASVLRGLGGLVRSPFCDLVLRPALALLALMTILFVSGWPALTAGSSLLAQVVAVAGAAGLSGVWMLREWRVLPRVRKAGAAAPESTFSASRLLTFSAFGAVATIYGSIDSLLLGALEGHASLGIYRISLIAVQLISGFIAAITTIVVPTIAKLHAQGDQGRLQRLLTITARATAILAAPLVLVLILFGRPLLTLGFGHVFAQGASAMAIAAAGQLMAGLAGPVGNVLNMTGHEQLALRYLLAGAVANTVLCLILIPVLGMSGAALAATTGSLLTNSLMTLNERRLTGLTSTVFGA